MGLRDGQERKKHLKPGAFFAPHSGLEPET